MAKKPVLTVVRAASTGDAPPRKLGRLGRALWNEITAAYVIDDAGGRELLMQACAATDRVEALAERIDADGEIIRGRNGVRTHPGLREELALRSFICRTLQRLGLNVETLKPIGRPPSGIGWIPSA